MVSAAPYNARLPLPTNAVPVGVWALQNQPTDRNNSSLPTTDPPQALVGNAS